MADNVTQRLRDLGPKIDTILGITGVVGASIGVHLQNGSVYTANFGHRDHAQTKRPDEETIYPICSLSKSFLASCFGGIASDKNFDWHQPVRDILPEFAHNDEQIKTKLSTLDLLAHRTGLSGSFRFATQDHGVLLIPSSAIFSNFSCLPVVHPLRTRFCYNNYAYGIAALVAERLEGKPYADVLQDRVLTPLGMSRTTVTPSGDNVAEGHVALTDGPAVPCASPTWGRDSVLRGSGDLRSCIRDLLTYYSAVIQWYKGRNGILKGDASKIVNGNVTLDRASEPKHAYGAGWAVTELPSTVGVIGFNGALIDELPVLGKGGPRREIWYHNGRKEGFFSCVFVIPDIETATVVLLNTESRSDCADWIGQLLVEAIIDNPDKNDYETLARQSAAGYVQQWKSFEAKFASMCSPQTKSSRPASAYVGTYLRHGKDYKFVVEESADGLDLIIQGLASQRTPLKSCGGDRFHTMVSEAESARRGRSYDFRTCIYIFDFSSDKDDGDIVALHWVCDDDAPMGQLFIKI